MTTTREIDWLAGLLEGEASFRSQSKTSVYNGLTKIQFTINLQMTDKDTVEKVARIWKRNVTSYNSNQINGKVLHQTSVSGDKAIGWMMTLFSLMSDRRKTRIREVIEQWKIYKTTTGRPRVTHCPQGHLKQIDGKCWECQRIWSKQQKQRIKELKQNTA